MRDSGRIFCGLWDKGAWSITSLAPGGAVFSAPIPADGTWVCIDSDGRLILVDRMNEQLERVDLPTGKRDVLFSCDAR